MLVGGSVTTYNRDGTTLRNFQQNFFTPRTSSEYTPLNSLHFVCGLHNRKNKYT